VPDCRGGAETAEWLGCRREATDSHTRGRRLCIGTVYLLTTPVWWSLGVPVHSPPGGLPAVVMCKCLLGSAVIILRPQCLHSRKYILFRLLVMLRLRRNSVFSQWPRSERYSFSISCDLEKWYLIQYSERSLRQWSTWENASSDLKAALGVVCGSEKPSQLWEINLSVVMTVCGNVSHSIDWRQSVAMSAWRGLIVQWSLNENIKEMCRLTIHFSIPLQSTRRNSHLCDIS